MGRTKVKSVPAKQTKLETPDKYKRELSSDTKCAYDKVWKSFYLIIWTVWLLGIVVRQLYFLTTGVFPNRKEINTFSQFRAINRNMLVWPLFYIAWTYLFSCVNSTIKYEVQLFERHRRLNVIAQVIFTWVFFYTVYYTTEIMKSAWGGEVMSGHIYTGILSWASIISTTIFMHKYKQTNELAYKIIEPSVFLYIFHMAYSFFWTTFVYHELIDSLFGLSIGSFISFCIQWSDGLWHFEIESEHTITYGIRFMIGQWKLSVIEMVFGIDFNRFDMSEYNPRG